MERRQFIQGLSLAAAGLASGVATASEKTSEKKPQPTAGDSKALLITSSEALKEIDAFADIAAACALQGQRCVHHCEEQSASGEAAMFAKCLITANQMVVVCQATAELAAMKASRLTDILSLCADSCQSCLDACREHREHWSHGMHLVCKACAEHCEKMLVEIKKIKPLLAS